MEQLYFSDEIQRKLSGIYRSGLTMIEAPAGYGKSTAVRWAMKKLPADQVRWFTAVSFQQDTSLDWFIRQIGSLDASAGNALRELGFLNRSNVSDAADILSRLSISEPCYLILDNFQLVGDNWPLPLLQALADRNQDGLHVVLISQNFKKLRAVFESSSGVTSLNSRDFLLGKRDILRYAQQLGLVLNRHQLDAIHRNTEGWAVAAALYLRNLKESPDKLPEFQDMDGLLYEFFWRKVSGREQELLLRAAAFDCIRAEQLPEIAPGQEAALKNLLVRTPLMHYDPRAGASYPHELLRHFLLGMLETMPPDFRCQVYEMSGEVYRRTGNNKKAVECFFKAGNDERLLSCELIALLGEQFGPVSYTALARRVGEVRPGDAGAVSALHAAAVPGAVRRRGLCRLRGRAGAEPGDIGEARGQTAHGRVVSPLRLPGVSRHPAHESALSRGREADERHVRALQPAGAVYVRHDVDVVSLLPHAGQDDGDRGGAAGHARGV